MAGEEVEIVLMTPHRTDHGAAGPGEAWAAGRAGQRLGLLARLKRC